MGNNALITVLGLAIIFSIVNSTLNRRDRDAYDSTYGYIERITAREIAYSSIQITLRKIDTVSILTPSYFPMTGNLDGGSFTVNGTIVNDSTLYLVANSKFLDTTWTIKSTFIRHQIPLPPSLYKGAFGIYPDSAGFSFANNGLVDGTDHDVNGNPLPASTDTVPPFLVRSSVDSVTLTATSGYSKPGDVVGNPKIKIDPAMSNPNTSSDQFKQIADSIFTNNSASTTSLNVNLGDSTHPLIVFCDGTDNTGAPTGQFTLNNNVVGWGLLVVKGNLKLNGGATWHGAIIIYGNATIAFTGNGGNAQVIGGILMGGQNHSSFDIKGGTNLIHSGAALNILKKHSNPYLYQIVDWYE